jgi:predicted nucleic acid-binding protein
LIVVDTSVAVKWSVPESGTEAALALLGLSLSAPDVLIAELGHVLTKKVQVRQVPAEIAAAAFIEIPSQLLLVECRSLDRRAFQLALELHHSIFDCYFLALAEAAGGELVTADEVFVRKLRKTQFGSFVRLLGESVAPS